MTYLKINQNMTQINDTCAMDGTARIKASTTIYK